MWCFVSPRRIEDSWFESTTVRDSLYHQIICQILVVDQYFVSERKPFDCSRWAAFRSSDRQQKLTTKIISVYSHLSRFSRWLLAWKAGNKFSITWKYKKDIWLHDRFLITHIKSALLCGTCGSTTGQSLQQTCRYVQWMTTETMLMTHF